MGAGIAVIAAIWVAGRAEVLPFALAWTWFVPLGALVTWTVGATLGRGGAPLESGASS